MTAAPALTGDDVLVARGVRKSFGGATALAGVDLRVRAGRVHALLGMNGAGKSTLVEIIAGSIARDAGELVVNGVAVGAMSPRRARAMGIATVHQRRTLVPTLSVAENVLLGRLPSRAGIVDWAAMRAQAREALSALDVQVDVNTPVGRLGPAQQTLVEIARELRLGGRLLILDEPTASLSAADTALVHGVVERLVAHGVAVVYITHHLDEVLQIADDVTVLRDGAVVLTDEVRSLDLAALVRAMVGDEVTITRPPRPRREHPEVLALRGLASHRQLRHLDLTVGQGEIVAVLGPAGDGQEDLFPLLSGAKKPRTGTVHIDGRRLPPGRVREALRRGVRCVSSDRLGLGLVPGLGVDENITAVRTALEPGILMHWRRVRAAAAELRARFNVVSLHADPPVERLSGGNQQKVLLGKWLAGDDVRVCLLEEPTGGVDVSAKAEIHRLIEELAQRGVGVLLASSDVDEVMRLADRVVIIRGGLPIAERSVEGASRDELVSLIAGGRL